ncbi:MULTISPECIES: cell division protein FtsZ [Clostridium]|uniref:Cell division protein FtsZ n=1 Tax=Clostridium beijerinckii TaxID=1520 RepID=A0AAW3WC43_CLOBE|nr:MULTISPECIES: cell division protein FtsZ [Clostridium]EHI97019.1 Tubulin/FtsZ GTPase [Clostridium sp. DL-VIII]MBC2458626.1 cell division protein FtsZ [Clostridium beijerinckii]MBC2476084.1 cell division protein FtsZ [Clostridium beijerinckii]MDG5854190.1 cell division protein FtsZ [Clostridium beijerinckii]NOV62761.1 cell division GTPase FtsZ [Clostridium beijerinckii]
MEKSKMLLVALGQGAGNIVDGLLSKNKSYNGLFFNSSLSDIKPLKNANIDKNVYLYPGTDGSGRDRSKSKEMIKDNANAVGTLLRKFPQTEVMVVFTSMAGGTGSGAVKTFIQVASAAIPSTKINVVAILPSLQEDQLSFTNAIECWNDINSVINLISDIKFVDNNKRNTYKEVNNEVVESLDLAYNLMGIHIDGNIDKKDSFRINTANGAGLVLKLYDGLKDAKTAIDLAIKNSVFAQPDMYDCDYLGINVKVDGYDPNEISKCFEVYKSTYMTYNNAFNTVVLGGCEIPTESIKLIKMALDDKNKRKQSRDRRKSIIIDFDDNMEQRDESTGSHSYDSDELEFSFE